MAYKEHRLCLDLMSYMRAYHGRALRYLFHIPNESKLTELAMVLKIKGIVNT